ncbi:hypothetical protein MYX65_11595, partial [Acidobacteria bacterium AH-259-L09]|nr:hypothetical protein [Acidobacteria bacterium AH-259-L09]
ATFHDLLFSSLLRLASHFGCKNLRLWCTYLTRPEKDQAFRHRQPDFKGHRGRLQVFGSLDLSEGGDLK